MGLGIGGIASPIPRKIYGWVGWQNVPQNSTGSRALTTGGFGADKALHITGNATLTRAAGGTITIELYVNTGSANLIGTYTASSSKTLCFDAYVNATNQNFMIQELTSYQTTTAISMLDIVSIEVKIIVGNDAGNSAVIAALAVEQLDAGA